MTAKPYLRIAASVFATIWLCFGINGILRPRSALEVFEFDPPASTADKKLVDNLMVLYGARDVFMGLAVYATAFFGSRKALGMILLAGSGVAFVDGAVCIAQIGTGQWNHWGYAPVVAAVGGLLLM
ncbi:hypothetical protein K469DRAFT_720609 [Zopfia rhizophila CBS 207.26]|uniref:Integral membrane protein n=1 Tax=Zopfia rhizophila CBS 207.26 TaxID=1314779 RepID=A0A6A6EIN8_9PEZI|nr:hypothetical protein K469DRAFT_720609 [Zopfia rhizophila CBS 207.26]